jgi:hypothetical protein
MGSELSGKIAKTCDEACILEEQCVEFTIGKIGGANEGKCSLLKAACTKAVDATRDLYKTSVKVNPSKIASKCTHKQ